MRKMKLEIRNEKTWDGPIWVEAENMSFLSWLIKSLMATEKKHLTHFSSPVGKVVKGVNPHSNPIPLAAIKRRLRVSEQQLQLSIVGRSPSNKWDNFQKYKWETSLKTKLLCLCSAQNSLKCCAFGWHRFCFRRMLLEEGEYVQHCYLQHRHPGNIIPPSLFTKHPLGTWLWGQGPHKQKSNESSLPGACLLGQGLSWSQVEWAGTAPGCEATANGWVWGVDPVCQDSRKRWQLRTLRSLGGCHAGNWSCSVFKGDY